MRNFRSFVRASVFCSLLSFVAGCTGIVSKEVPADSNYGSGSGSGGSLKGEDPGTKRGHLLNDEEYNNTLTDLLGLPASPAKDWVKGQAHGFDNIADVLSIDAAQYKRYFDTATALAASAFADAAARARIVTCNAADDTSCVQRIVQDFGLRAFRRPLFAEEVATFQKLYGAARALGESHDGSVQQIVRAMLASAEFLYRLEFDPEPNTRNVHVVAPYEQASRLSYFLWRTMPDSALFERASNESILNKEVLSAEVDRMLADPKASRFLQSFPGQWLEIRKIASHSVDATVFPMWSADLAKSLADEAYAYFAEFVQNDKPWKEFLTARVNFVDNNLAGLYGVAAPGSGLERVEGVPGRMGFLGLGAFLSVTSYPHRTAPTLRARWILDNMLCAPPEPPPAALDIAPLEGDSGTAESAQENIRERLAEHRENKVCAACHEDLDPFGLALENFDAIGRYRTAYPSGSPVDATATLSNGSSFDGLASMAEYIAGQPDFEDCTVRKLFVFSLGRGIEDSDEPYIQQVLQDWLAFEPSMRRLIKSLAVADPFRMRRGELPK